MLYDLMDDKYQWFYISLTCLLMSTIDFLKFLAVEALMRNLIRVILLFIFDTDFLKTAKSEIQTMVSKGVILHICKEEAFN